MTLTSSSTCSTTKMFVHFLTPCRRRSVTTPTPPTDFRRGPTPRSSRRRWWCRSRRGWSYLCPWNLASVFRSSSSNFYFEVSLPLKIFLFLFLWLVLNQLSLCWRSEKETIFYYFLLFLLGVDYSSNYYQLMVNGAGVEQQDQPSH